MYSWFTGFGFLNQVHYNYDYIYYFIGTLTCSTVVPGSTDTGLSSTNKSTFFGADPAAAGELYTLNRPGEVKESVSQPSQLAGPV